MTSPLMTSWWQLQTGLCSSPMSGSERFAADVMMMMNTYTES